MASLKHFAVGLAFLFLCGAGCGQTVVSVSPQEQGLGPRERVMFVAESLIGTTEATGRNDGPIIEAILRSANASKGDPYCAAFNTYCYLKAGVKGAPVSAWSPDWVRNPTWTRANGGESPRPADSWGIYFPSKKRVAHTGLVETWGDKKAFRTIEANTSPDARAGSASDRDGDGIWRKIRLKSQIYSVRNWIGD